MISGTLLDLNLINSHWFILILTALILFRRGMRACSFLLLQLRTMIIKELEVFLHHLFEIFKFLGDLLLVRPTHKTGEILVSTLLLLLLASFGRLIGLRKGWGRHNVLFVAYWMRDALLLKVSDGWVAWHIGLVSTYALSWIVLLIHWLLMIKFVDNITYNWTLGFLIKGYALTSLLGGILVFST